MEELRAWKPIVSVIMPAYNAQRYLAQAIRSLQAQTFTQWELIVVDDCSGDDTAQIVSQLAQADPRIRLYRNEQNLGAAKSRNRGLELQEGEFVAFLDSDDVWRPKKLELQVDYMRQTNADLTYTAYAILDAQGRKAFQDYLVPPEVDFDGLLKQNVIGCSTAMLRGEVAKKYRFSEEFYHEDYVLWLEMLRDGCTAAGLREVLVEYRFHEQSKAGNKTKAAAMRWQIYRDYLGLSLPKSIWYFAHYGLSGLRKYRKTKDNQ